MKHPIVQAAVFVAVLTLGACGSDAVETSASDQGQEIAGGEPTGVDAVEAGTDDLLTRMWVKPDLVDCIGEAKQQCMQIAESEDGEYLYFYDPIEGFEFVEGTSYVIDVRIDEIADPPADGSSFAYTLVKVIEELE